MKISEKQQQSQSRANHSSYSQAKTACCPASTPQIYIESRPSRREERARGNARWRTHGQGRRARLEKREGDQARVCPETEARQIPVSDQDERQKIEIFRSWRGYEETRLTWYIHTYIYIYSSTVYLYYILLLLSWHATTDSAPYCCLTTQCLTHHVVAYTPRICWFITFG